VDRFAEDLIAIFIYLDLLHVIGAVGGGGGFPVGSVSDIGIKDLLMHFGFHSNLIDLWGVFQVG
jgi:hypothetical protein